MAVDNAIAKLRAIGPALGFPHSSAVKGTYRLRELRPRGGRSITQALYRQFGDRFVIGAYGPEEAGEPAAFTRACELAEARLESLT
ncbi:hypothetical protein SD72_04720 [Leucobacter komagatae]|uniref:Uncharacterized protein n=1 Tax=Leucobacter komagatae TaxID=55969 RepID=A0A0D0IUC3_9MICO|nr:hypothetical protein SD72_04720 [Leucobacter komagatae]